LFAKHLPAPIPALLCAFHARTRARTHTRTHARTPSIYLHQFQRCCVPSTHAHAHARTRARTHTRTHAKHLPPPIPALLCAFHAHTHMHARTHAHTHARTHAKHLPPPIPALLCAFHARTHARKAFTSINSSVAVCLPRTHARTHARTQSIHLHQFQRCCVPSTHSPLCFYLTQTASILCLLLLQRMPLLANSSFFSTNKAQHVLCQTQCSNVPLTLVSYTGSRNTPPAAALAASHQLLILKSSP